MTHGEQRYVGKMANGATSADFYCEDKTLYKVFVGTNFSGTALTVQNTDDGTNFYAVRNTAGAYSIVVGANGFTLLPPLDFLSTGVIRLVAAGAQTADITIVLYGRDYN